MSAAKKAGFVEAPCTIAHIQGMTMRECAMKVSSIERTAYETTFIGRGVFDEDLSKLTVDNGTWVELL